MNSNGIQLETIPETADFREQAGYAPMFTKNRIKDLIRASRFGSIIEQGQEMEYFRRVIEEINARNYSGLLTISYEYGLVLGLLDKMLDRKANDVFRLDQMPRSCEIHTLGKALSKDAEKNGLVFLGGEKDPEDGDVRALYFQVFGSQPANKVVEAVEKMGYHQMFDYIWDKGLGRFFNARYRALRGVPDEDLPIDRVVESIGMPAVFDESALIKRYMEYKMLDYESHGDLRDNLSMENAAKSEAIGKLNLIYGMFEEYPPDFKTLRRVMNEFRMEVEVEMIEQHGIDSLTDYVRVNSLVGAREVARRYDFVYPVVSDRDMQHARRTINKSYYSQAQKTKKGKFFIRSEVLYNLNSKVKSGECYRLPGGYLVSLIRMTDGEEHYLFGRYPSRTEKDMFNLSAIGYFYLLESPMRAVSQLVKYYISALSRDIRTGNALKKMLIALPIVLSLAVIVGVLYVMILGGPVEALLTGGGIMLVGMAIAAKNGYDEDIRPSSHESIPGYLARKAGKITASSASLAPADEEQSQQSAQPAVK